jgi:ABC-type transport system substrate-binding protein
MRSTRAIAASAALLALACGGDAERGPRYFGYGGPGPRRGGVLRFSINVAARTLDPAIAYDETSMLALHLIHDTLLGYQRPADGPGTTLVPQLAERWSVSPDGRLYTFVLREGIEYSDGRPCVAADFEYALERILKTPASPFIGFLLGIEGARSTAPPPTPPASARSTPAPW